MSKKGGYVYLLNNWNTDGIYKIGVTRGSIEKRIKELQTGNPTEIVGCRYYFTKYPFMLEKMLHNKFSSKNIKNEWFEINDDDALNFVNICKKYEDIIISMEDNPFFQKNLK